MLKLKQQHLGETYQPPVLLNHKTFTFTKTTKPNQQQWKNVVNSIINIQNLETMKENPPIPGQNVQLYIVNSGLLLLWLFNSCSKFLVLVWEFRKKWINFFASLLPQRFRIGVKLSWLLPNANLKANPRLESIATSTIQLSILALSLFFAIAEIFEAVVALLTHDLWGCSHAQCKR